MSNVSPRSMTVLIGAPSPKISENGLGRVRAAISLVTALSTSITEIWASVVLRAPALLIAPVLGPLVDTMLQPARRNALKAERATLGVYIRLTDSDIPIKRRYSTPGLWTYGQPRPG